MAELVVKNKKTSTAVILTAPTKTSYYVGDVFDPRGLVVRITYSDSTTKDVSNFTYDGNAFPPLTLSDTEQILLVIEDKVGYKLTQSITVTEAPPVCTGCDTTCSATCLGSCSRTCNGGCQGTCGASGCTSGCVSGCSYGCHGGCGAGATSATLVAKSTLKG